MKKSLSYICAAALGAAALAACSDDFTQPPMIYPELPEIEATTTVDAVKETFWSSVSGAPVQIGTLENGDSVIIRGRVCSSDETGNIYKNVIIQSEDEQGRQWALTFAVNKYDIYKSYKFGQEVFVNLTGMYVGGYSGLLQIGEPASDGKMTFMTDEAFTRGATAYGLPKLANVDTTATTVAELNAAKAATADVMMWQSRLVRVEGVSFEEPGQPFAGSANTNRYVKDAAGNRLLVRNSAYASFKNEPLPYGTGNVTGILSYFGSDWQILLIDIDGVEGFDGEAPGPAEPGEAVSSLDEKFEGGSLPEGWTTLKVKGDKAWYFTSFDNNGYAAMTGYKGTAPFDAWLISPAIDMAKVQNKVLSFQSQVNGYGATTTTMKVAVLTAPDPATATVTDLSANWATAPASGYSGFVSSGDIDLSAYSGVIYIGFQYQATQDANYATWCIDNVLLGTSAGTTPVEPGEPGEGEFPNGDGSQAAPYNVAQIIAMNPGSTTDAVASGVWAKGYIVGFMPTGGSSTTLAGAVFGTTDAATTNLVLGPTADCTDPSKCIGIQLPTAIRGDLALANKPENLGKALAIKGDVMKYCGGPGIKNGSEYDLEGGSTPGDPETTEPVPSVNQNFEGGTTIPSGWTLAKTAGNKDWYIRTFNNNNYATVSGYQGTAPFDAWFISPAVDLSQSPEKVMSFISQVNGYGSTTSKMQVYAMSSPDPATATLTELSATWATAPASGYSDWVNSGEISLASLSGIIYIGFRYTATADANYATWCVDNVMIGTK